MRIDTRGEYSYVRGELPDQFPDQLPLPLRLAMARSHPLMMFSRECRFGDINECPADVWMDAMAPVARAFPDFDVELESYEREQIRRSAFPEAVLASPSKLLRLVRLGWSLQHLPVDATRITPAMHEAAVRRDPAELEFIPKVARTEALCRIAVERQPSLIRFVPKRIKSSLEPAMADAALRRATAEDALRMTQSLSSDCTRVFQLLFEVRSIVVAVPCRAQRGSESLTARFQPVSWTPR